MNTVTQGNLKKTSHTRSCEWFFSSRISMDCQQIWLTESLLLWE